MLFSQNFLINTKNLSGAAILIFRKCFRNNSLLAFYKIGVLKTSAKFLKAPISGSLFNNVADLLDCITDISQWISEKF